MTNRHTRLAVIVVVLGLAALSVPIGAQPELTPQEIADLHTRAGLGDASAQYDLGLMYGEGRGVAQNDAVAFAWYRQAAAQGVAEAQFNVGFMYSAGRGAPQDQAAAVTWYRRAAEQGLAEALVNVGIAYAAGQVVAQDNVSAYVYFSLAVDRLTGERQDQVVAARSRLVEEMTTDQFFLAKKRLRLDAEDAVPPASAGLEDQSALSLPIRHRHAFTFHHATLTLRPDSIEFMEPDTTDSHHDFIIRTASITELSGTAKSWDGTGVYTLHFSQSTEAGRQITFEVSLPSLYDLVSWLETYVPDAIIQL